MHVTPGELLDFERRLANVSPPLPKPASITDRAIRETLRNVCEGLSVDHGELWQWYEEAELFVLAHSAAGDQPRRICALRDAPRISARILKNEFVQLTRTSEGFGELSAEMEAFFSNRIQCAAFLPLRVAEHVCGVLCVGSSETAYECADAFAGSVYDLIRLTAEKCTEVLQHNRSATPASGAQKPRFLELNEQFRLALECFPNAAIVSGEDGKIVLLNSGAAEMFGYNPEELSGKWIGQIIPAYSGGAEQPEKGMSYYGSRFGGLGTPLELWGVRQDGATIQIEITQSPIRVNGGSLTLSAITDVTDRQLSEKNLIEMNVQLLDANETIRKLKEQLEEENIQLKQEVGLRGNHLEVIGQSEAILRVLINAELVAATDSAVLLLGETGTGKELIARAIHRNSRRADRPMVNVNCAALPATLVENELFGRERGAYTGALTREVGRFELADRSTIFLDEIGELPLELQAKLLRVLQEGEFERLGSSKTLHVDVRVIAATSKDLQAAVREGTFREDLYYRLNVFPIRVPPLRERRDDIPMLTWHFLRELGQRMGRDVEAVRAGTMKALQGYPWPGNVRELRNVIERNLIIHPGRVFEAELPEATCVIAAMLGTTIEEVERNHITQELERSSWRVRGLGGAAEALGLKPTTLEARMKKLGIVRK